MRNSHRFCEIDYCEDASVVGVSLLRPSNARELCEVKTARAGGTSIGEITLGPPTGLAL